MSEFEVRKARKEVEKSVADFEKAVDRLLGQIQEGADKVSGITSKVRGMVDVDSAIQQIDERFGEVVDRASGQLSRLRESAEQELEKMDLRPVASWSAVLISGFTLGWVLSGKLRH